MRFSKIFGHWTYETPTESTGFRSFALNRFMIFMCSNCCMPLTSLDTSLDLSALLRRQRPNDVASWMVHASWERKPPASGDAPLNCKHLRTFVNMSANSKWSKCRHMSTAKTMLKSSDKEPAQEVPFWRELFFAKCVSNDVSDVFRLDPQGLGMVAI